MQRPTDEAIKEFAAKLDQALGALQPHDNHRLIIEDEGGCGYSIDIRASAMEGKTYNFLQGGLDGRGDYAEDPENTTGKMARQFNMTSEQVAYELLMLPRMGFRLRSAEGESDVLVALMEKVMPTSINPTVPACCLPRVNVFPALVG